MFSGGLSHPSIAPRLADLQRRIGFLNEHLQNTKAQLDVEACYAAIQLRPEWLRSEVVETGGVGPDGRPFVIGVERVGQAKQAVARMDIAIADAERERAGLVADIARIEKEAREI